MTWRVGWRLSMMMLLQYAVSGAWGAVAGRYYQNLGPAHGFTGTAISIMFCLVPLTTVLSPFAVGQVADRYFNAEKVLGVLHLLGTVLLVLVGREQEFARILPLLFIYALLNAPTIALTNSLALHHLPDPSKFGFVRVFGTLGWMLAGLALGAMRHSLTHPISGDLFYLAAAFSAVMGLFSFCLPATPPKKEAANPLAFMEALQLLKRRDFAVFLAVSLVAATALDFHYIFASAYLGTPVSLGGIGVSDKDLPIVMDVAQLSEVGVMLLQPLLLPRLGIRRGVTIGTAAWALRYGVYAFLPSRAPVVASLAFHGLCVVFFFVTIFLYVDRMAPRDIRASAQSLATLVVFGLGRFVGSLLAGRIYTYCTVISAGGGSFTNWRLMFLVPCVMMTITAIVFPMLFREAPDPAPAEAI